LLDPAAARVLLAAAGVPVVETVQCESAEAAAAAAARLGYPVVAKVAHPELTHKSDVGGVRLGLRTEAAVRSAAGDLLALASGAAVLVQPQREGIELVIGGVRDPDFGPVVMVGFGGVLVEARRDVQLAIAPVDEAQARAMLRALRGAVVFTGWRGRPAVDLGPVEALIVTVGELLAEHPAITELDLNPVLVGAGPLVAVDWRITLG
jgi:acyl-CoA synthetase (NDP forming)